MYKYTAALYMYNIQQTVDWLTLLQVSDDMAALKACHLVKDNTSVKWIQTCTCTV